MASQTILALDAEVMKARTYIEACIDFSDEEVSWIGMTAMRQAFERIAQQLSTTLHAFEQGVRMQAGGQVLFMGPPNVGKSSLFNALSGREDAIVTEYPGTTRDVLRSSCVVDGLTLELLDTAGLRETIDPIERAGIERTKQSVAQSDVVVNCAGCQRA